MISKELFCKVMEINIERLTEFEYKENMASGTGIFYFVDNENMDDEYQFINIYELAHKCKEWAFNKNEAVSVYKMRGFKKPTYQSRVMLKDKDGRDIKWKHINDYDSEPEAIFKACQWILDNKVNQ